MCHQIAPLETILGFQQALYRSGSFDASFPMVNPRATMPEPGDMIAIQVTEGNVTLMAFVRSVSPGMRSPGENFSRITVTAGYRPRPFAQLPAPPKTA